MAGASVPSQKVTQYLLNDQHQRGASKCRFFEGFGFMRTSWEGLVEALTEHGRMRRLIAVTPTEFGPRYVVECEIRTPDGRNPCIRTVWQGRDEQAIPQLITAYPRD
jgi:hypothetical protein